MVIIKKIKDMLRNLKSNEFASLREVANYVAVRFVLQPGQLTMTSQLLAKGAIARKFMSSRLALR